MQKIGNRRQIALKRAISTAQNPIIPPPLFDDSWRGPDTQRGRFVPYLEKDCGGRKGPGHGPGEIRGVGGLVLHGAPALDAADATAL